MASSKTLKAAEPIPPPEPDDALYSVSLRMQVGSLAGDAEYHVRMTRSEIEGLLRGTVAVVRLPDRYGPANEFRFVPLTNIVEITLYNLQWPAAAYVAETVE
jgi:hypothetical protein